jgi:hypothetical protein
MNAFLSSTSALILGIFLLLVAACDYVGLAFFWDRLNPNDDERLNRIRALGAYWIAGFTVTGLFFIEQYVRRM